MDIIYNEYERLGGPYEGSFATVYKVKHIKHGYVRALKVLNGSIASESDKNYQTFVKECEILLKIGNGCHPHIVRMYYHRLINNQAIVEMDYIDGETLVEYLNKKFMSIDEVYTFIYQIGGALAYIHRDIFQDLLDWDADDLESDPNDGSQPLIDESKRKELIRKKRIIHNDLHSGNVMRRRKDGYFFLLDFGLAIQNGIAVKSSSLRKGAPEYRSPEKWNGADVERPENDIYSFGILLYEVLTGQPPFPLDRVLYSSHPEKAIVEVENRHLHEKPAPIEPKRKAAFESAHPGELWKQDYPAWLEQMVMKCLAKSPSDRYADAKELIEDFNCHLSEDEAARKEPQHGGEDSRQQRVRHFEHETGTDFDITQDSSQNQRSQPIHDALGGVLGRQQSSSALRLSGLKEILAKYAKYIVPAIIVFVFIVNLVPGGGGALSLWMNKNIDADSLVRIGYKYYYGESGKSKDYKEAVKYFRQAAKQGNPTAQIFLGNCYYYGQGVEPDSGVALEWYSKAAAQGDSVGQYNVGMCYYNKEKYEDAVKKFYDAAYQGYTVAQYMLGYCNENNIGMDTASEKAAIYWYRMAAVQGDTAAQGALKRLNKPIVDYSGYINESYNSLKQRD